MNDDDLTRVSPLRGPDADRDATIVKPLRGGMAPVTGTAASQGTGEPWQRIADLDQGEGVTVGSTLKGRFFMERELGRGGMGVVYLARDERKVEALDRDPYVAVKVLNDEFRKHPDALIALQREARRAQRLANDHIVRVYDFDKDGTNVFMTMEYVEGDDLRALIRRRARDGMPFAEAWPLIEGMGEALRRAHDAGVVHSDFKPGNVMVTTGGVAKVFDFGIARAAQLVRDDEDAGSDDDRTVFDAASLGAMTPAYASLEMLQGKAPAAADDIYAFACVVVELLTGRHPFDKRSAEEALAEERRPPLVPGLDKRQQKALCDALSFRAEKRTGDIGQLLAGLRKRRWRERAAPWLAAAGLFVAVAGAGAWLAAQRVEQRHVADTLRRFAPGQTDGFHDEDQVREALAALDGDARRRVTVDGADTIDAFLVRLLASHWDPDHGRFDYAGANQTFQLRADLKTFAPRLDRRRDEVGREREDALNSLDTALSQAVGAGRLFGDGADDVPALLARIRAIDPRSRLLGSPELELKFDIAIGQAIKAGDLDTARGQLAIATRWFPASSRLAARALSVAPARPADAPTELAVASSTAGADDLSSAQRASRLESLRQAAAAGDLGKARARFGELRDSSATGGASADDEVSGLLATAALGAARKASGAGRWKDASASIATGLAATGDRDDLRRAQLRYDLATTIMAAARVPSVTPRDQADLRSRLDAVGKQDPDGLKDMQTAMVASRKFPDGSLDAVLKKIASGIAVADPCGKRGMAGSGRECVDTLAGNAHGPALIVVPDGRKSFAMTRFEVSTADVEQFCKATHTCSVARGGNAAAPARLVPVSFARRYAGWLSEATGHVYRLPTDDEWLTAARAGANWDGNRRDCGDAQPSGRRRPASGPSPASDGAVSGPNPWGLVGMTGGVWEWVTRGSALSLRGGSSGSGPATCSVTSVRESDGSPAGDVGFRLVREVR